MPDPRIVALEEHFVTPELLAAWEALSEPERTDATGQLADPDIRRRLLDTGAERLAAMDAGGVDQHILSLTTPGPQNLSPGRAVEVARGANDALAAVVRGRPDRFGGFASLPTPAPVAAARELERAVVELGLHGVILNGRTGERNIDHADFSPIYEAANALRAPLYLHPQLPAPAVGDAYYAGFSKQVSQQFGQAAIGWHYETGVQLLRLVLSGTFDRFPDLQIVTGHWGEVVLFYLERVEVLDQTAGLKRPVIDYFRRNISVTASGIFSRRYLRWAMDVLGPARILFATDYPYVPESLGGGRAFLEGADLSDGDRALIAHGNWERLTAAIRR